jgi:transposase-like protein
MKCPRCGSQSVVCDNGLYGCLLCGQKYEVEFKKEEVEKVPKLTSRFTVEQKREIVAEALTLGVPSVSEKRGVHKSTIYNWIKRYQKASANGNPVPESVIDNSSGGSVSELEPVPTVNPAASEPKPLAVSIVPYPELPRFCNEWPEAVMLKWLEVWEKAVL